ncbi:c-type cytochrome [Bradyrhizobium manausense]|uniref:c-type cytochrome n=1 Tax=Bradyrhizobium manausense TaxID=989370 RepID=UPI001BAA2E51|nr:c-type cytochrome [Bradyrhizobium manausense]MBR0788452.1 c-type cytochrome [Bradyrhizobium manausense]
MHRAAQIALVILTLAAGIGEATSAGSQDFAAVERGRYLANAADCGSCHTVPGSDHPLSGGRPIETPFGTLVAPNITSDRETGIGAWSDDEFDAAVRTGMRRDGKRLYPAMPFPYFARMTREDIKDIRAYLETVEPVHNPVKVNQLPFPLNQRMAMTVWDKLYFTPGEFMERSDKSKQWNRGAYLVEGPGHCGACHTPKTALGGDKSDKRFQGYTLQGWVAPDITSGQGPLADWSADDLAQYLKTGHNRFAAAAGLMGEVVELSTSKLSDDDTKAMAAYLKDQSGPKPAADSSADSHVMAAGGAIYQDLCAACHKSDGTGVPNLIPNLSHAATVNTGDPTTVLRVILQGAQSVATDKEPTGPAMPAFGWQLNDAQVAAVATYVRNHWGKAPPVSEDEAKKERTALDARTN